MIITHTKLAMSIHMAFTINVGDVYIIIITLRPSEVWRMTAINVSKEPPVFIFGAEEAMWNSFNQFWELPNCEILNTILREIDCAAFICIKNLRIPTYIIGQIVLFK
jgi:hypothetical protein